MLRMREREDLSAGEYTTSTREGTVFEVDMRGRHFVTFKITPATEDLTACKLQGKVAEGDTGWVDLLTSASDWQDAKGMLVGASGEDLASLSAGTTAWAIIQSVGFAALRLRVTAAGDGSLTYSYGAQ